MVVGAQSREVGVEEGELFQEEGVEEEGPYLAVEEVGVEVRNQAWEEVVELQYLVVVEAEEEVVGVANKVQAQVRVGEEVAVGVVEEVAEG